MRPGFRTTLFYRVVRHPLNLGFLIAFWAAPTMTVGHLLFAAVTTAWILLAMQLEERDLMAALGTRYAEYRQRVPMLVPGVRSVTRHDGGVTDIRGRVWRDGKPQDDFEFSAISDYLAEDDTLVWCDIYDPDHAILKDLAQRARSRQLGGGGRDRRRGTHQGRRLPIPHLLHGVRGDGQGPGARR